MGQGTNNPFLDGHGVPIGGWRLDTETGLYIPTPLRMTNDGAAHVINAIAGQRTTLYSSNSANTGAIKKSIRKDKVFQFIFPAGVTASVRLQGSTDAAGWKDLATKSANDLLVASDPLPLYRVVQDSFSGGKVIAGGIVTVLNTSNELPSLSNNDGSCYSIALTAHTLSVGDWVLFTLIGNSEWNGVAMPVYAVPNANTFKVFDYKGVLKSAVTLQLISTVTIVLMNE